MYTCSFGTKIECLLEIIGSLLLQRVRMDLAADFNNVGVALHRLERYEEAEEMFKGAVDVDMAHRRSAQHRIDSTLGLCRSCTRGIGVSVCEMVNGIWKPTRVDSHRKPKILRHL